MTPPFQRVLAFDCSGAACSVALYSEGQVTIRRYKAMTRGHAEALIPMIAETMAATGEHFSRLAAIAVTVGPGAFTGIRIGLAAARGIGLAAGIPILGVTTFAAVAEAVQDSERRGRRLMVLLDSKRGDLFVQEFDTTLTPVGSASIRAPEVVAAALGSGTATLAGDGVALVRAPLASLNADVRFSAADGPVEAAYVASAAVRLATNGERLPPIPLYLRAPEIRLADRSQVSRH